MTGSQCTQFKQSKVRKVHHEHVLLHKMKVRGRPSMRIEGIEAQTEGGGGERDFLFLHHHNSSTMPKAMLHC